MKNAKLYFNRNCLIFKNSRNQKDVNEFINVSNTN